MHDHERIALSNILTAILYLIEEIKKEREKRKKIAEEKDALIERQKVNNKDDANKTQ